ncbi:HAD family hydrolase [Desulfosporosinus sp. BICA1-9]|uniref:HAD family hydrolase n=1 Tax=Desulfosporosinus sp. BICA1-9 TaxID=1531958 RepID=UPI00054B53EE|nr:HAD-IA family hydrolase [Desulfosporosinus sp. BICA1-9]KJS82001.1 MAG: haloacid dehalogenase [Desulfosporosinus sp. BICA1-9]HBW38250.1 haloacid dehalogenase [Desulfosporosinus sp.]
MKLKGFIFDLDGTLINSLPVVYASFCSTLVKFIGREYSSKELASLFGPSEEGIFKKLFPDSWEESLQFYLDEYDRIHASYAEPFPGVHEALSLLQEREIRLAIVSGKGPGSMEISLKHSGLKPFFEVILTGSEHGASKPEHIQQVLKLWNYPPENVVYVGDIAYDVKAAKEVGVLPISAIWAKTAQVQKVLDMNPAFAFDNVESFIEWIKQLG